jgi:transposase
MKPIIWVGLDVHKSSTTVAILGDGSENDVQITRLGADLNELRKLLRGLAQRGTVRACYEASGAGFVVHRVLEHDGFSCSVIAPSLIPARPGDRLKTDKRDAVKLATLYRAGLLTPVHVPTQDQEAIRDLVRTRQSRMKMVKAVKQRIHGMLLRQGLHFSGKSYWTKGHRAWLARTRQTLEGVAAQLLGDEIEFLEYLETQIRALDDQIETIAQRPPYREPVEALTCLRGVRTLTAMTILTELGDWRRFASPRALMAWTGLVPSEHSTGDRERRGGITKSGNAYLRRVLIEAAHNHRTRAGSTLILERRRAGKPPGIIATAVKAQHRLSRRYWKLMLRKHRNRDRRRARAVRVCLGDPSTGARPRMIRPSPRIHPTLVHPGTRSFVYGAL